MLWREYRQACRAYLDAHAHGVARPGDPPLPLPPWVCEYYVQLSLRLDRAAIASETHRQLRKVLMESGFSEADMAPLARLAAIAAAPMDSRL